MRRDARYVAQEDQPAWVLVLVVLSVVLLVVFGLWVLAPYLA
jgi:hypothetical protein